MFNNYEIKIINNQEVLCIYLDYNYEFSFLGAKFDKSFSLIDLIKKYINDKNIIFNGKVVLLIVGGIVVGTLTFSNGYINSNNSIKNQSYSESYKYSAGNSIFEKIDTSKIDGTTNKITTPIIETKETVQNKIEPIVVEEQPKPEKKTIQKNTQTETKKQVTVSAPSSVAAKPSQPAQPSPPVQPPPPPIVVETPQENKNLVTVNRSNGTIIQIEFEEYIVGVVGAEMPASFNIEALKAQAIVARTYTLKRISENKPLTDTVSTQAYKDNNQLKSLWGVDYNKYYSKVKQAVDDTKGMYITYNGKYIDAVYHSTSNGYTEDAKYVWGYEIPYLKSVSSEWDINASSYLRVVSKPFIDFNTIFGITVDTNTYVETIRNLSNRVIELKINGTSITPTDFRDKLGLRSTDFDIVIKDSIVEITTRGYGHGVGLSQYGANGMGNSGFNYRQIIDHYYQNVIIKQ